MTMRLPNGFGSVYKLSGNRRKPYAAVLTYGMDDEGKYKRRYLGYAVTKKEAMTMLAEYHNKPFNVEERTITLLELWERWKNHRIASGKNFPSNYKSTRKHLSKLHNTKFIDIRPSDLQDVINSLNPPSAHIMKSVMNMMYKYARYIDIIQANYADSIDIPIIEDSTMHKPFTNKEIESLLAFRDNDIAMFAYVSIYTGMRPSEIIIMKRDDVHIEKRYMSGGMKTPKGKNRIIPIHEKIVPIIQEWYDVGKPLLYTNHKNYADMLRDWHNTKIPAIENHLPHDGRHTCTTKLDDAGTNKKIQKLILGHTSKDIEERVYTHKTIQQLIDAINKI